jgi:hypothetical protein
MCPKLVNEEGGYSPAIWRRESHLQSSKAFNNYQALFNMRASLRSILRILNQTCTALGGKP